MTDSELLQQFTQGSEQAFAELVRRHVDLVFAAALRHVAGDRHGAEDIVQQVFVDLARKARELTGHPTLAGWLYSSTRYTALNTRRSEQRRAMREKQSVIMNVADAGTEPRWEQIRPVIDEALQELDEEDRQSVLLRFFGQQPFATIATQLGITENAAQKRVDRALDRLSATLKRRGISSAAGALGLVLADSCVAAPSALAGTVTTVALAKAAGLGAGALKLASGFKIAAAVAVVGVVGWAGVKWSRPERVGQNQIPAPVAVDAKPAQAEVAAKSAVIAETPMVIEPEPQKPEQKNVVSVPASAPVKKIHVVKAGDTLRRIATAFGVSQNAIRAENPGYDFVRMRVGNHIQLPANATLSPSASTGVTQTPRSTTPIPADQLYIVQPGDTLVSIARKTDLLMDELRALNPETNWQQLRVGQQIRAP